jgi:hypothetical protein
LRGNEGERNRQLFGLGSKQLFMDSAAKGIMFFLNYDEKVPGKINMYVLPFSHLKLLMGIL